MLHGVRESERALGAPEPYALPFHPWWHHPSGHYVGRHRGDYQHWEQSPPGTPGKPLPYGVRDIKITPYIDVGDLNYAMSIWGIRLPTHQTISFSGKEEYAEFQGDGLTTTRKASRED